MSLPAFLAPHKETETQKTQKGNQSSPTANKIPLKQGSSSRSYTNFRSAITALRTHTYYSLVAAVGIFIGTTVTTVTSILVQSVSMRPHTPLYAYVMTLLFIGIAGFSCIASGLVMMNILLAMVKERSHEFSVRLAVGARRRDIRAQILWEALLLSIIGGITGSACGLLIGFILTLSLQMPFSIDTLQVILLVGTSVMLCVVLALYPGQRAARVDCGKVLRTG